MLLERRSRHNHVATLLAAHADAELTALLRTAQLRGVGVGGGASSIDIDGSPVFVKRVPITDWELAHPHSTANLFDLPARWQYGMYRLAGPGFGAWRELAVNQTVTEGVLAGEAHSFPLLYHWRVLPGRPPIAAEHLDIDAVVAQFGGNRAVRARFEALASATSSLVLFFEHLPDGLPHWLSDPVGRAATVERQLLEIAAFLRNREVLHLDGHFGNIRADNDQLYLVDFGLATSPRFDLSDAEREFAATNTGHDADYASMQLVNWLITSTCRVPPPTGSSPVARDQLVRRCATGDIPPEVPLSLAEIIARHAPAASRMNDFCSRLFDGDLNAEYPGHRKAIEAGREISISANLTTSPVGMAPASSTRA
ncbi:serine/threonine protein phosphatase [Actinoplanes sp. NPDC026670]|uniref:serine/threonine protein phosphatase n=1 Tax=Actinoplanes sp. NPDC026670 TaxID=3154700 RepID=UPI0033C7F549